MLTLEEVIGITSSSMTEKQARALYGILYGEDLAAKASTMDLLKVHRCDKFEAHRILAHVLTHMMSDADNARYVSEQLGLEG
jgi:hypothetical protein